MMHFGRVAKPASKFFVDAYGLYSRAFNDLGFG